MNFGASIVFAVLAAAAAILTLRNERLSSSQYQGQYDGNFVAIEEGVFRQGYMWLIPWKGSKVHIHVFLIRFGNEHILVDVGAPQQEYERILLNGLDKTLGNNGKLRLLLLTHGHIDHIGAIKALVAMYPDIQVAFHEKEAPYVTGGVSYNEVPSDNDEYKLSFFDVRDVLPASRVLHLGGTSGDVANAFSPTGHPVGWLPPHGAVRFQHAPGHAPGQVAYLHKASGSMIAGDVFTHSYGSPAVLRLSPNGYTANVTQHRLSSKQVIAEAEYDRAYCAHDAAVGLSRTQLQRWASSL